MFCEKCGTKLAENEVFCPNCGAFCGEDAGASAPVPLTPPVEAPEAQPAPEPAPAPAPEPQPAPEPAPAPQPEPAVEAQPEPTPTPTPAPEPQPAAQQPGLPKPPVAAFADANQKNIGAGAGTATAGGSPDMKKLLPIIAAAAAVIVFLIIIICIIAGLSSGSTYKYVRSNINALYSDSKYTFFNDTNRIKPDLESGINAIAVNYQNSYLFATSDDELFLLQGGNLKKISSGDFSSLNLAPNANVAYYVKDENICIYNGSEKKISEVDGYITSFVVSPDGSAAAWTIMDKNERDEETGEYKTYTYGYKGGKAEKLASVGQLYSITNGGGIIYGQSKTSKLAVCKGFKDEFESVRGCTEMVSASFDCSQILFYDASNGKTFLYNTSLKDSVPVCSGNLSVLSPNGCIYSSNNFDNFLAMNDGSIYRFTRKGDEYSKSKVVGSGYTDYEISEDGKFVVYLKNSKLYKKDTTNENADAVTIAKDVSSFVADRTLKNVYYKSTDRTLRYTSGDESKTKAITSDDVSTYIINTDSGVCTFIYSDALYYSKNGGDRQKINEVKDIKDLSNFYAVDGDNIYFVTSNGSNYTNTKIENVY